MDVASAVRAAPDGIHLDLEVTPGAAENRFPSGTNPWRRRLGAKVSARAEDGEANDALARLVAEFFGVGRGSVTILAGARDRRKTIHVAGVSRDAAIERLRRTL